MINIALLTMRELVRRRFVLAAILITGIMVLLTAWGFDHLAHSKRHGVPIDHSQVLQISSMLLILIAYMFSFVLAAVGIFIAAPSITNDVESGVLLPILTRPLSRTAVVTGKALGFAIVLAVYTAVTGTLEFAVVKAVTGYIPPYPAGAILYLYSIGLVMIILTIALSTRLSAIAASIVSIALFGMAWIGGIVGSIGDAYSNDAARNAGTISQLLLPTDAMWREAVYRLEPVLAVSAAASQHGWGGPFLVLSPPPLAMILWTIGWIAAVYCIATRSFAVRDL